MMVVELVVSGLLELVGHVEGRGGGGAVLRLLRRVVVAWG